MTADARIILRGHDDRAAIKQQRDGEFQLIADHFMPRKDMTVTPVAGELRQRRVTSSVPMTALRRSAALVVAYMVDPTKPFIKPNVLRGLQARGRSRELDDEARDALAKVEWDMFDRMMLPQSGFLTSAAGVSLELLGFGTGVMWTGRQRGFGPKYQRRPLRASYLAVSDEGDVDTLDYCWRAPVWKVLETWPEARKIDRLLRLAADPKTEATPVELMHTVLPRRGGGAGRVATEKPFADVVVVKQDMAVIHEAGWDSFPYSVPRLNPEEGSPYGTGLGWEALPEAMVLNHLQAAVERGVDLDTDPVGWLPIDLLDGAVDRRPGAMNFYDPANLGFQTIKDAIQYTKSGGDVRVGVEYMRMLADNIETAFYVDWMRLRENGNMTATEVQERRDLRLRAMSAIVPSIDREWMGPVADRTLAVMVEEDQLPPMPESLSGVEVDWDYAGPLAMAQMQGQGEAISRLLREAQIAVDLDPKSIAVLEISEGLRDLAETFGAPASFTRSRGAVAEMMAAEEQRQEEARQAEVARTGAQALSAAGQGVNNLVGAAGALQAA